MSTPFEVRIPQSRLDAVMERVRSYRPFPVITDDLPVTPALLGAFVSYWSGGFDWRQQERRLNDVPQYLAEIDGERLHFVHVRSGAAAGRAVVLIHGWPNTYQQFLPIVDQLAHPERFGGSKEDGVDVIVPSLPGYGFSDMPRQPMGPRAMADRLNALMIDELGYESYFVHGGDFGAMIGEQMALRHPERVLGLHTHHCFYRTPGSPFGSGQPGSDNPTPAEVEWAASEKASFDREFQYFALQASDPLTISYAMMDSPVGQAAWLLDKFLLWSDVAANTGDLPFDRDKALTEIMIYSLTDTFYSAAVMYRAVAIEGPMTLAEGQRIEAYVGFAAFADPHCPPPPAEFIRKSHNLVRYSEMSAGGHFPALEQPALLTQDLQGFIAEVGGRTGAPARKVRR
jgi:microsomal epoxide hydrolase